MLPCLFVFAENPVDPGDPEETEEPVDPDPVTGGTTRPTWTLPKAPSSMTDSDIQQPSVYSKLSDPKVSPKDLAGLGDLVIINQLLVNPYNAGILLYNPWRTKGFFNLKIIINVLVSSFRFI